MKKKAKLFTTFASLGLALALMGFGVWAATDQNLRVNSTVGFAPTAVNIELEATVKHWKNNSGIEQETITYKDATNPKSGSGDTAVGFKTPTNDLTAKPIAWNTGALTVFDDVEAHRWIVYQFDIINKSGFPIVASIAQQAVAEGETAPEITTENFYYESRVGTLGNVSDEPLTASDVVTNKLELEAAGGTTVSGTLYLVVYLNDTTGALTADAINFDVVIVEDKA